MKGDITSPNAAKIYGRTRANTGEGHCFGVQRGFEMWKYVGKRKHQYINLSHLSIQNSMKTILILA